MAGEGDYYTTAETARILRVSDSRIRQMLARGELEGSHTGDTGRWQVSARSVHTLLENRRTEDLDAEASTEPLRVLELEREIRDLAYRLGRSEARAELTEKTESTLREERDRLTKELEVEREERRAERERAEKAQRNAEQLDQEREQAQEEAKKLREELEAERNKGFWRRLFGG